MAPARRSLYHMHLHALPATLRRSTVAEGPAPGYAAGNLLNLALHAGVDLVGAEFSRPSIWQADLRGKIVR